MHTLVRYHDLRVHIPPTPLSWPKLPAALTDERQPGLYPGLTPHLNRDLVHEHEPLAPRVYEYRRNKPRTPPGETS